MAFSIEYLYQIADKFTAPLKKMESAGGKFDGQIEKIQNNLGLLENKMDSTSLNTKSLSTNLKSIGDGFDSKAIAVKKSFSQIEDSVQGLNTEMRNVGNNFDEKVSGISKGLLQIENKADMTKGKFNTLNNTFPSFGNKFNSGIINNQLALMDKKIGSSKTKYSKFKDMFSNFASKFKTNIIDRGLETLKKNISSAKQKYDKFNTSLSNFGVKFNSRITKIQKGLGGLQNKFKSTGEKMANMQTGLAAVGAGVFLKGATDDFREFQRQLNLTKAVTGSTADQMDLMKNKALEWGSQTQFSSLQVAGAMAELGKMGNKTNQIIDLMPGTMALAAAGEISMAEAATFSMQAINQMGLELSDAEMVADTFATGAANASTSVVGLASAFSNTGLAARGAGLDMNTTTVALMALASQGQEGAIGGTMLKNSLLELQKMTPKVRKGFDGLGIDIDNFRDATTGQVTDLFGLIDALKETGDVGIKSLGDMFGKQALQGMSALVGTSTEKMLEFRNSMKDVSGGAERMKNDLMDGLSPMIQFESVMGNLKVIVGGFVVKALNPLLEKFNAWLGNIQQNNPQLLKMFTYFAMGVTAVGAILIPLGLLISAIGSIIGVVKTVIGVTKIWTGVQIAFNAVMALNPIALIIIGIIALVAIIVVAIKHWDQIKLAFSNFMNFIKPGIDSISAKFTEFINNPFFQNIKFFFIGLWGTIIKPGIDMALEGLTAWFEVVSEKFTIFKDGAVSVFSTIGDFIIDAFSKVKDFLSPFIEFAMGGFLKIKGMVMKLFKPIAEIAGFFKDLFKPKEGGFIDQMIQAGKGLQDIPEYGYSMGASPYIEKTEEAPIPGYGAGANASADASVRVYTEKGVGVEPWTPSGELGYNMTNNYQRGM